MLTEMLKAKLHKATITEADLTYEGSLTIDRDLMDASVSSLLKRLSFSISTTARD